MRLLLSNFMIIRKDETKVVFRPIIFTKSVLSVKTGTSPVPIKILLSSIR